MEHQGVPSRKSNAILPIAVIGGGPSGLMAAITAASSERSGRPVILFNKNPNPGKKISAIPPDEFFFSEKLPAKKMAARFGNKSDFVAPIFKSFGYGDLVKMFKRMKMPLEADQAGHFRANGLAARELMQVFLEKAVKRGVQYKKSSRITDIYLNRKKLGGIMVNNTRLPVSAVILSTGSFSSPKYGATRDGYEISKRLGHRINELKPALIDFITCEKYGRILAGEYIENINISIFFNGKPIHTEMGAVKFTANGISGPVILNHSAEIIEKLAEKPVSIRLDFIPDQPRESFETWLVQQFISRRHVQVGQFLSRYFNENIIRAIEAESRVKLEKSISHITNLERKSLIHAIKDFRLTIKAPKPFNNTRGVQGGVSIDDINPKTCESRIVKSLYFAGDVIDVLGPWGGYNMQFAFSSGYVAGKAAADNSK